MARAALSDEQWEQCLRFAGPPIAAVLDDGQLAPRRHGGAARPAAARQPDLRSSATPYGSNSLGPTTSHRAPGPEPTNARLARHEAEVGEANWLAAKMTDWPRLRFSTRRRCGWPGGRSSPPSRVAGRAIRGEPDSAAAGTGASSNGRASSCRAASHGSPPRRRRSGAKARARPRRLRRGSAPTARGGSSLPAIGGRRVARRVRLTARGDAHMQRQPLRTSPTSAPLLGVARRRATSSAGADQTRPAVPNRRMQRSSFAASCSRSFAGYNWSASRRSPPVSVAHGGLPRCLERRNRQARTARRLAEDRSGASIGWSC